MDVEQLQARLGDQGSLTAAGRLSLFEPEEQPKPLTIKLRQARFSQPRITALADGEVLLGGSLLRPVFSGEIQLSKGTVNIRPGQLATTVPEKPDPGAMRAGSALEGAPAVRPVSVSQLLEESWNFQQPLVLLGPEVPSAGSEAVSANVPDLPFLRLDRLRLRFGPDLRVVVPNVLNFNTAGLLTLNGPVDASLRATGVVRLKSGRLGLFTTNFSLDPDAPNVAVFTPSLGLIPYLDVALRTRVSDSLGSAVGGVGNSSIYDFNQNRTDSALDQLNLVKVVVKVSGPADRLGESIELRSTPPLSRERLVALIGGNSLAGLTGGNAGAALATVLGQSLLSPVVGTLTDALGQRVSFALYPTYVAPNVDGPLASNRSRRVPSQLVLGSEIGLDLSERFNFSVLAAPNRSDVPPR
ncbi:translocation/assembly module TamB domain-containing protein [Cyanobium sp. ATX-6F1]|uniref:translocation/assembly module TamB domain-containing protein n=1 Tax=Cyanobium sp. ATX-6F1 TaxID=3137388 RepID=UPI0039BE760F